MKTSESADSASLRPGAARPSSLQRRLERAFKRFSTSVLGYCVSPHKVALTHVRHAEVRRLLLIRQHNQMGDMVLSLPALNAWRRNYPQAHLVFLTAPICQELLENHPDIDLLIVFRKMDMWKPWKLISFLRYLKSLRVDMAVVMGSVSFSMTSALLAWLSGAKLLVGVESRPFGSTLSEALYHCELPIGSQQGHEIENNLHPLRYLGLKIEQETPQLTSTREARGKALGRLRQEFPKTRYDRDSPLVILHVGAGKRPNVWPSNKFAFVARGLVEHEVARLVLTEGPNDAMFVDAVCRQLGKLHVCRWQAELGETMGLLALADLLISNDTGLAHLSAALGVATLALFGPTDSERWRPTGDRVQLIVSRGSSMDEIDEKDVLVQARNCLRRWGSGNKHQEKS